MIMKLMLLRLASEVLKIAAKALDLVPNSKPVDSSAKERAEVASAIEEAVRQGAYRTNQPSVRLWN